MKDIGADMNVIKEEIFTNGKLKAHVQSRTEAEPQSTC